MSFGLFLCFLRLTLAFTEKKRKKADGNLLEYKIPLNYNFLEEYSFCNFYPDSKNCLGDYAQGLVLALSHRMCISNHNFFKLSYQYLSACDQMNLGCEKGNTQGLIYFLQQNGSPSDADLPYQSISKYNSTFCSEVKTRNIKLYKIPHDSCTHITSTIQIQEEIYLNGPVFASMTDISKSDKIVTVEIIGWEEKEELYWIIYNEVLGTRYIRAGYNEAGIESNVFACEIEKSED